MKKLKYYPYMICKSMRKSMNIKHISEKNLSHLENDMLDLLWKMKKARVREIYNLLIKKRDLAHSSVAVMLDRLYKKGHVKREVESCKGGFRYIYCPSLEKSEFQRNVIENSVNKIIKKFGSTAINYFDERFGKEN